MKRLIPAAFAAFLAADTFAAGLSATRAEIVTAEFASAAEAEAAQIAVAPLPEGRKLAFTSRWDDSNWQHVPRAEMFKRVGMTPMFFLNGDLGFLKDALPKLKALGARFGNHTVSHPFLMESGINIMFNEVVENKLRIECFSDMPNTSFVIPYNWECSLEPRRAAMLAKILVDNGIFVSSDWPLAATEQPASEWMPGHTFGGNDNQPTDKTFYKGLSNSVENVAKDPNYPKVTFGIHSWCKPEGLITHEKWLNETIAAHKDDWWITDDAHYGAYRYEFWHAKTKKLGVKGNVATFEVLRHDPAFLGEVQPLTYTFIREVQPHADTFVRVEPVKVSSRGGYAALPVLPAKIDRMENGASAEFPGLSLTVKVDEAKGELSYEFTGDAEVIAVVVNPAPLWANGRILAAEAKKTVSLGAANGIVEYREGDRLYVVGVDFVKDGARGRLYATETVPGSQKKFGGTPRDAALVLGPIKLEDFPAEKVAAFAVPGVTLPNIGDGIHQFWRSMADKKRCGFSAAAYIPWDSSNSAEFKAAMAKAQPADRPAFLVAADFECDAEGEKDLLLNRAKWEKTSFWINGTHVEAKGSQHRIAVRKGLNRIVYSWEWFHPWVPQACLMSVCDDKDVNKAVKFVMPPTERREGVFESDGFSVEFAPDGSFRKIEYAGRKVFSVGCEVGKSLGSNDDNAPKATFESAPDRLVCTRVCPLGSKSDDYSEKVVYTVTRDSIEFEGEVCVREGVKWKGFVACATLSFPIAFCAGRRLELVDTKGEVRTVDYPAEYNKETCRIGIPFTSLSNGEWKIELVDAQTGSFTDLREWKNDYANFQLCPKGGLQWGGKVSDGTTYVWKWRIGR